MTYAGTLHFDGQQIDGATFTDTARRLATLFMQAGVKPDGVVSVLLRNDPAWLIVMEACRLVGASYVPINWHAAPAEIQLILEDSGSQVLIGHSDLTHPFAAGTETMPVMAWPTPKALCAAYGVKPEMAAGQTDLSQALVEADAYAGDPERLRGIFAYTSGSTGRPKGIVRTRPTDAPDGFDVYAQLSRIFMHLTPGDRFYMAAPMYHSGPNALSYFCIAHGEVDVYVAPKFDAEQFLADVERYKITHTYIVPTLLVRLLKLPKVVREKYDVSSLRFSMSTGSPFPTDVKAAGIEWFGPIFYESYGASEMGFITLVSSEEAIAKPGTVGKVLPGGSIKILDDDGHEMPTGEPGLIYVHLPMFGDFDYTQGVENVSGQRHAGHATVGDVGYLDEDDYLFISDRKKDMIISGGANIFPAEIESVLIDMPEILDCAVFGAPHPEFGERVVVAVKCRPGADVTLETVRGFIGQKLAKFKLPTKLDIHDELPREDSGKIFKNRLRAPYWEGMDKKI